MFPSNRSTQDTYLKLFLRLNGLFSILCIVLIFLFVLKESLIAIAGQNTSFFFDDSWFTLEGKFNMLPMVVGSLLITLGSIILAFPIGLFAALFAMFYIPKSLSKYFLKIVELYTGIPSVIFGFWGLMNLVPLINSYHPPGQSLLTGILILTIMIFPIITLNLTSAIELSSKNYFKISNSLGLSKSTYIWKVLLPNLKGQMISASVLSIGRAIGETMAVLMVCGNIVKVPSSVFDPVRTLTANIALEMAYAMDSHRSALFLSGFVLLVVIAFLYSVSNYFQKRYSWKS